MDNSINQLSCVNCGGKECGNPNTPFPSYCTTTNTEEPLFRAALDEYLKNPETSKILKAAAEVEGYYKGTLTRVEEICLFAEKIGAKRIGIANCLGCLTEARLFAKVLHAKGFDDVIGVTCKVGAFDKTEAGIPDEAKCFPGGFEPTCNPIAQAMILNNQHTDLNVIVGLCVGHDTLFIKYSEAPVTYLLVKDRVMAHNPAGALYLADSFYGRIMESGYPPANH